MPLKTITAALAIGMLLPMTTTCFAETYDPLDFERPSSWYMTLTPGLTSAKSSQLRHDLTTFDDALTQPSFKPSYALGYQLGFGLGFHLDHNFRADIAYTFMNNPSHELTDIRFTDASEVPHVGSADAIHLLTHTLMANLYYDFYPYTLKVHPYVGIGAGVAFTKATSLSAAFPSLGESGTNVTIAESGFDTKFAYQSTIGFQRQINDTFWLDAHYRWLNIAIPKFFTHRQQIHSFALGLTQYLEDEKRGHFTADVDPLLGPRNVWYINAHGGLNNIMNNDLIHSELDDLSPSSADASDYYLGTSFKLGYHFGGAIGFYLNPQFRTELALSHQVSRVGSSRRIAEHSTNAYLLDMNGQVSLTNFMLNAYYDIVNVGRVYKPYIGTGIGLSRIKHNQLSGTLTIAGQNVTMIQSAYAQGRSQSRFAFQMLAGARKQLSQHCIVNYGYKFFVIPKPGLFAKAIQNHMLDIGFEYQFQPTDNNG